MPRKKKWGKLTTPRVSSKEAAEASRKMTDQREGIRSADISEAARTLAYRRARSQNAAERKKVASMGGKAYWASMSAKERAIEQRRRSITRIANMKKKRAQLRAERDAE